MKSVSKRRGALRGPVYLDASALAKLYLPEPESDEMEAALLGRTDLYVSEVAVTEVISALARRCREGELPRADLLKLQAALLDDFTDGSFVQARLDASIHRMAEAALVGTAVPLRAADALHLALAASLGARTLVTYDRQMRAATPEAGLHLFPAEP